ncbi:elongator complex protein 5 [Anthonomus grandis grandis]|uniref:elongator complex protein 5 n=1 Tax=Anthonomus grandis grandis TaxID=2921223 RepID=UPI00216683CE|nr:elongator complex protein 5 [Anthonomus grandis grandis]
MLKTYINTVPYTRLVLITDSLQAKDPRILNYIINQHLQQARNKIHYFVFEGVFDKTKDKYRSTSNIVFYNFVTKDEQEKSHEEFEKLILSLRENDVLVVDSLANVIFLYGVAIAYRLFNSILNNKALKQAVTVLHRDLLLGDQIEEYFSNLSTFSIDIQPKFLTNNRRVLYKYKKSGGKIISELEEYRFEGSQLISSKIEKPDIMKLIEKSSTSEVNPENLSTFRIGLSEEEKNLRDKVVLPYLPKPENDKSQQAEGKIFYEFDEQDDWDEEDPDDDLDI